MLARIDPACCVEGPGQDQGPFNRLPAELSFLSLDPECLVLSALKRSEQGDAVILRFFNPTSEALRARIGLLRPFERVRAVRLDESPCPAPGLVVKGREISVDCPLNLELSG